MKSTMILATATLLAAIGALRTTDLDAQQARGPVLSLSGGPSTFDRGGSATGLVVFVRLDATVFPFLIIEPGLGYSHHTPPVGPGLTYLLPEVSAQLQVRLGPVRPFIGGGFGFAEPSKGTYADNLQTLHAVAGVRVAINRDWSLRAEARARSLDPFKTTMLDFTAGIGRRL
jgi:hypothetical protein